MLETIVGNNERPLRLEPEIKRLETQLKTKLDATADVDCEDEDFEDMNTMLMKGEANDCMKNLCERLETERCAIEKVCFGAQELLKSYSARPGVTSKMKERIKKLREDLAKLAQKQMGRNAKKKSKCKGNKPKKKVKQEHPKPIVNGKHVPNGGVVTETSAVPTCQKDSTTTALSP